MQVTEKLNSLKKHPPTISLEAFKGETNLSTRTLKETEEQTESFYEKFQRSILDQNKDYPKPEAVLLIKQNLEFIAFLTLKSFSLWQGKQKSKKTTALALAIAAFITGNSVTDGFIISAIEGTVLVFDTEQGESYAARTMKLILKLANLQFSSRLIYCDLREFPPVDRRRIIQAAIENTPDLKIVVIDGLVDLMNDFMDAGEAHLVITEILKWCSIYNIHIAGVLHQNKNDKNARAHIGSIATQKCEINISTEVDSTDRAQSFVTCEDSRDLPFEKFAIRWDKGSLPRINEQWSMVIGADIKTEKNHQREMETAKSIFKAFAALTHKEAIAAIMAATKKGESTAKTYLKNYIGWGFITQDDDGRYRAKMVEGSRVNEGQNGVN